MGGKKKGKGKKKGGEDKVSKQPFPQADAILAQFDVNTAQKKINDLERQNKELTHRANTLKAGLEQTKAEQADVYIYLHKKLDDNFDVIAGLEARIQELTTNAERSATTAARELEGTRRTSEKQIALLQGRVEGLQDQLDSLHEFQEKKDQLEAQLAQSISDLELERQLREEEVADLERQNVASKDKLKKEMFMKIKETKQSILEATNDQLDAATKRTMAENEQMATELQYQSRETERLLAKFASLQKENQQLRRDRELIEETQQELVKRTHFYQRLIKKLHERIKVTEESNRLPRSPMPSIDFEEMKIKDEQLDDLSHELQSAQHDAKAASMEADIARSEAIHATDEYRKIMDLQDETVSFLMQAVADVKRQVQSSVASGSLSADEVGSLPLRLDRLPAHLRERALQQLLAKMQLFQATLWSGDQGAGAGAGSGMEPPSDQQRSVSLPPIGRHSSEEPATDAISPAEPASYSATGVAAPPSPVVSNNPFAASPPASQRPRRFKASGLRGSSSSASRSGAMLDHTDPAASRRSGSGKASYSSKSSYRSSRHGSSSGPSSNNDLMQVSITGAATATSHK